MIDRRFVLAGAAASLLALPARAEEPLRGDWYDAAAPSPHSHHRWAVMEQFAHDFVRVGPRFDTYRTNGMHFADYYAYGQPVLAAAGGTVVTAVNDEPEDERAMQQPNETQEAFFCPVARRSS